jgi:hypothetical protein
LPVRAGERDTGVRLIADWRLTWADQRIPNYLNDTLKAWILHPALCIAYASDDHIRAERAIRSIGITWHGYVDLDLVLDRLQQESSAGSEFLLASETKGPSLSLIRSGGAYRQEASAWIGDKAAYALYLRLLPTSPPFTNPAGSASARNSARWRRRLIDCCSTGNVPTGGEIAIVVVTPLQDSDIRSRGLVVSASITAR